MLCMLQCDVFSLEELWLWRRETVVKEVKTGLVERDPARSIAQITASRQVLLQSIFIQLRRDVVLKFDGTNLMWLWS